MKKRILRVLSVVIMLCVIFAMVAQASISPGGAVGTDEQSIRIGFIQSEEYNAFSFGLAGIANGLVEQGLIEGNGFDPAQPDAGVVWGEICATDTSPKIQFVQEMFFTLNQLSDEQKQEMLQNDKVDLYIVMGTVAGVFLTENNIKHDYMVFATADPVGAGIVKSETERYNSNSYAHIDNRRFARQISLAYEIIEFERLGVVYADNAAAYSYSGIEQVKQASELYGFEILELHVEEAAGEEDFERYYDELEKAYAQLIDMGMDTLYITTATTQDDMLPTLLRQVHKANIPTVSQVGINQVEAGVMLGATIDDPVDYGRFGAARINEYIQGVPIDELEQVFEITPKYFLNYDTVKEINFEIPFRTLLQVDTIYRKGGVQK